MTELETAREAFLSMLADASVFEEQPDGDVNEAGRMIDCTTFKIITGHNQLEELAAALGIKTRHEETIMDALTRELTPPTLLTLDESDADRASARAAKALYDETMQTP